MEITEDIATNQCQRIRFQLFGDFGDKGGMCIILFDSRHAPAFARKQFERNASRPCKQIERIHPSKSIWLEITLKIFSFAKSVVGRALKVDGTSKRRRPYIPLIIRIMIEL